MIFWTFGFTPRSDTTVRRWSRETNKAKINNHRDTKEFTWFGVQAYVHGRESQLPLYETIMGIQRGGGGDYTHSTLYSTHTLNTLSHFAIEEDGLLPSQAYQFIGKARRSR